MKRQELAQRINLIARQTGKFTLRSGMVSDTYFDKYRFEADPILLAAIAAHSAPLVPAGTQILAGLELGGVPLATALGLHLGLNLAFVRKEAKTYGTCRLAEGSDVAGKKVLVVEDVISTGGQVIESTQALVDLGADIVGILVVIDRQSGGRENIEAKGWSLASIFTREDLEAAAL
jgi:orotate phosphoribosyltransferase